jgi:hypothetical protein
VAVVFGLRQAIGHGLLAWSISTSRKLLSERFMRPSEIVDFSPGIECALGLREIAEVPQREDLGGKRAVKALVLAAALRMVWTAVDD